MIYKIIHSKFELDLIDKEVDTTQENAWFDKNFNLQYSLPFDTLLTEQLDAALGHISHINSTSAVQFLNVKLYRYDQKFDAKLVVDQVENNRVSFSLEFGYEQFPGFNLKLRQLPLEEFEYPESDIQAHALSIYDKTYPDVNYNFHQIIVPEDTFNEDDQQWINFEGFINQFKDGNFVANSFDAQNAIAFNKNIMQPQPYLLHVLKKGFEAAGFTLTGDILDDPEYKKASINLLSKYYSNINSSSNEYIYKSDQLQSLGPTFAFDYGTGNDNYTFSEAGVYKILGNAYCRNEAAGSSTLFILDEDGGALLDKQVSTPYFDEGYVDVDITLQINDADLPYTISVVTQQLISYTIDDEVFSDLNILDLTITKITEYDSNDNAIPSLLQPSKIKLNECVPDNNFGDLVKALVKHRNYSLDVNGDQVIMNKINDKLLQPSEQDLSGTEVQFPTIENKPLASYLLEFQRTPEDYEYDKVFVDQSGSFIDDFEEKDNTKKIQIELLPLQRRIYKEINTVKLPDDNQKNIYISMYDGTLNADNKAENELELLLPYSYSEFYADWLQFIINSKIIKWSNLLPIDAAYKLYVYKKSFAYEAKLVLKKLVVSNITRDYARVDIEAHT